MIGLLSLNELPTYNIAAGYAQWTTPALGFYILPTHPFDVTVGEAYVWAT